MLHLKKLVSISLDSKKTWMTSGIQQSIYIKNKLLQKFINKKDPKIKVVFHEQYKTYRNLLSTLMKQSKQNILKIIGITLNNIISVAKETNSNIKFSPKHYTDYLPIRLPIQTKIPFS